MLHVKCAKLLIFTKNLFWRTFRAQWCVMSGKTFASSHRARSMVTPPGEGSHNMGAIVPWLADLLAISGVAMTTVSLTHLP